MPLRFLFERKVTGLFSKRLHCTDFLINSKCLLDSVVGEACAEGFSVNSEDRLDIEGSCPNTDKPKVQKEVHFPEKIKVKH